MKSTAEENQTKGQRKPYLDRNLQIIFGVTLMAILGVASIAPVLPEIRDAFGISDQMVVLLVTFFTLPGVILTPVLGILADRYGRKKILVPSLILFGISGGACAFASDFGILLILRFFQGFGAASLGVLNITVIADLYSGEQRTMAMGYNVSVQSVGTGSWPLIGAFLGDLGWFFPFLLPLISIPIGLVVLLSLKNPEPKIEKSLKDYFGGIRRVVGNYRVIILFVAGIINFFLIYGVLITYFQFYLAGSFGVERRIRGVVLAVVSYVAALISSQIERFSKRYTKWWLIKSSYILFAVALVIIPFVTEIWLFSIPILIFGFAMGILMPIIVDILTGFAPKKQRAAVMSIYGMTLRLGQSLGPVVMSLFFILGGISLVFYAGACFSIIMFTLMALIIRNNSTMDT
ncbi:MAG: MFS transporter [Candidatus Hodarchaeota archaeon]